MLEGLRISLNIPKFDSVKDKEYGCAKDNSIASIGKIIKY